MISSGRDSFGKLGAQTGTMTSRPTITRNQSEFTPDEDQLAILGITVLTLILDEIAYNAARTSSIRLVPTTAEHVERSRIRVRSRT
jgi:hypothetical protein